MRSFALMLPLLLTVATRAAPAAPPEENPAQLLQDLKAFGTTGSVLMIAAHPDDENTQLLAYLARGRLYRTAYLSLTRGDGGQNLLGPEFGAELGLIRTEELLAARRVDGAQQFFSRAMDFGFSKRADETLRIWDQQAITADIVRVIRTFRPDVIVTRFNPDIPGGVGTHGHHTASAILAREAFNLLAKDPHAFPEQLTPAGGGLQPWQPKRIFMNMGGGRGGGGAGGAGADVVRMDIAGSDPVLNESFGAIAAQSRAQHKTQGFGQTPAILGGGRGNPAPPRPETFTLLAGEPASKDIMDGIDTTWGRFEGGAEITRLTEAAIGSFTTQDPAASLPALLEIRKKVLALRQADDPVVVAKRGELDRLIARCIGLEVLTTGPATAIPGQTVGLTCAVSLAANVPVKWVDVDLPGLDDRPNIAPVEVRPGQPAVQRVSVQLASNTPVTQPYWLREEALPGLFRVADEKLIGRPESPPALPVRYVFEIGGQRLAIADEPRQLSNGSSDSKVAATYPRRLAVLAPVSLAFPFDVALFAPGESKKVSVTVSSNTTDAADAAGKLRLAAPADWRVEPSSQAFQGIVGSPTICEFTVTAPPEPTPTPATLTAVATINGHEYSTGLKHIAYPHIPYLTLQPPATLHAVALDLKCPAKKIAYLPGAGDSVAACIEQMGCTVTEITGADLTAEKLKGFDAVVLGVRAMNVRTDLGSSLQGLFDYAAAGGTVVMQYNRPDSLKVAAIAPFALRLSSNRVTDENATVTFLAPDARVLNEPNKITQADFANWVQERGIYYPASWDSHFTPILSAADPGEQPLTGALLVAPVGQGHFVYTSLVFFRQLPAANPGAYRLFANLLSLGEK